MKKKREKYVFVIFLQAKYLQFVPMKFPYSLYARHRAVSIFDILLTFKFNELNTLKRVTNIHGS